VSRALLETRGLCAFYGATQVLFSLDIKVTEGGVTTLLGANGAGKTTTLRALSGVVRTTGEIGLGGQSIAGRPIEDIVRRGVAHVPQGRGTFVRQTVEENLQIGAITRRDRAAIAGDLSRVYGYFPRLRERRHQQAGTLSGGEQQMLAVGRALMTNPRLLILDEATEGLAPLVRDEIWRCLARLKADGLSILVIDKNVEVLTRLADHHYVLEKGRVVWSGTSAELRARADVQHKYLGV
jgi:branched-chain amino acid transport system ATP-binding protein